MGENLELFENSAPAAQQPLADQLRPRKWADFCGLAAVDVHLVRQLESGTGVPPSLVLWGPPGCGKTTLAKLIGGSYDCRFVELSAVLSGVKDVRETVAAAKLNRQRTILFIDEIHRFNKAQQDAFLPHVEGGAIVLIGATTENPSFYLTGALLSRVRVVQLPSLSPEELERILRRGAESLGVSLPGAAGRLLIEYSAGDARRLLNSLEGLKESLDGSAAADETRVREFLKGGQALIYDRDGDEHYNMASAFIKSLRGSDPDAALYWAFRMLEGGEDPRFIARRMIIFASEDIGNADPRALQQAVAAADAYDRLGLPEGRIPIAQCITYLACAPKSNRSYLALGRAVAAVREHGRVAVPLHLRNAPTKLLEELGCGSGYEYPHDAEAGYVPGVSYLPREAAGAEYYRPSDKGYEKTMKERLLYWRGLGQSK